MKVASFGPERGQASRALEETPASRPRTRRLHRWIAILFTGSVAANFAAMPWGPPPLWITYAPLPPLLTLMVTGLAMLIAPWLASGRGMLAARGDADRSAISSRSG